MHTRRSRPSRKTQIASGLISGVALAFAIVSCGSTGNGPSITSNGAGTTTDSSARALTDDQSTSGAVPAADAKKTATLKAADSAPDNQATAFGKTVTFHNGVTMIMTLGARFTPSDNAAGDTPDNNEQLVTLKITNTGTSNFDPSTVTADATYGSDGDKAEEVFDSTADTDGLTSFDSVLRPGRSLTSKGLVAVPRHETLSIQVSPEISFDDQQQAVFEGTTK